MKRTIDVLVKSAALTCLVVSMGLAVKPAQAAIFTVNGISYDINPIYTSYAQVTTTPWFGNQALALELANAVGYYFGTPNPAFTTGPWFIVGLPDQVSSYYPSAAMSAYFNGVRMIYSPANGTSHTFAVGSIVSSSVPEPLTILGAATAIGFGINFKKRLAQSQKSKKDVV